MIVGLLLCDEVPENLQRFGGTYLDMFQQLFPDLDFEPYNLLEHDFPHHLDACEAYMTTGSRYSVYDRIDWILRLEEFVRSAFESNKAFIGVCFGHQMIGQALGGKVEKSNRGWCIGLHDFKINSDKDWIHPYQPEIWLPMSCQDQITILPEDSEVLGTSTDCPYALIQLGTHMLGIQAHPEHPAAFNRALFESRIDRIGVDKVEIARASFSRSADQKLFAHWVMNFLCNCVIV